MTFLTPLLLLAFIPVAALALAYVLTQRRRQRYTVRFATLPMLDRLVPRKPRWRRHLPAAMILLCLTCLGFAAARPQVNIRVPYERATVIVAIDTSGSMQADDVEPDRLEAAKSAAADFVDELPSTFRVGVVQFAGTASVVAQPSTDHTEVRESIEQMTSGGGGTAIGESIYTALDEVTRLSGNGSGDAIPRRGSGSGTGARSAQDDERIPARMVLLSDGANTVGRSPDNAAEAAKQADMPVSTISYGTADGSIDGSYGRMAVPVDPSTLRQVASASGGQFYSAASNDQLREVYQDIGSSIGWHLEPIDITPYLALAGLLIACGAGALSLRWFSRIV